MRSLILATAATLALALLPAATHAQAAAPAERAAPGLVIKHGAWGKLRTGMTAKQAQKTGMVSHEEGHCAPGYEMAEKYHRRGYVVWKGQYPHYKVKQIVIAGPKEHTPKGIHVGSTLRQLRKAYPGLSKVYRAREVTGQKYGGENQFVAFTQKKGAGVLGYQFPSDVEPTPSSKIELILISPKRDYYPGC